jgi:iron complex transport system ATP-binding protein
MHVLAADSISFSYDRSTPVLRSVTIEVEQGEFLSIVGPNGSGKTTLLRLLDRIFVPTQGRILLQGKPMSSYTRSALARQIAFVPQDSGSLFPFTVYEVVLMGRAPHMRGRLFESDQDRAIARQAMEMTDISRLADKPLGSLSGGERQRAFIARALAQGAPVILLDEPNAHLDIAHQVEVFRLMRSLNRESGVTVISVSHDLNLASAYSDRIAVLLLGDLVAIGPPARVLTEQIIDRVFHTRVQVDGHPSGGFPRVTLLPEPEGRS